MRVNAQLNAQKQFDFLNIDTQYGHHQLTHKQLRQLSAPDVNSITANEFTLGEDKEFHLQFYFKGEDHAQKQRQCLGTLNDNYVRIKIKKAQPVEIKIFQATCEKSILNL